MLRSPLTHVHAFISKPAFKHTVMTTNWKKKIQKDLICNFIIYKFIRNFFPKYNQY